MVPNRFYRWLKRVIPYVFWVSCIITIVMMLIPSHSIPKELHIWDKIQHALTFFVLMFTGGIAYSKHSKLLGVGLVIYGTAIEVLQEYFTATRNGDPMDAVADTVGVVIGFILFIIVYKLSHNKDGTIA